MSKIEVMALLEQFAAHMVTMKDAADQIDALYNPPVQETHSAGGYMHWVACTTKGLVHVYHVSDCANGEQCELFQYLSADGNYERHNLKRGHEYDVTKDGSGSFIFTDSGRAESKAKLESATQTKLLDDGPAG